MGRLFQSIGAREEKADCHNGSWYKVQEIGAVGSKSRTEMDGESLKMMMNGEK